MKTIQELVLGHLKIYNEAAAFDGCGITTGPPAVEQVPPAAAAVAAEASIPDQLPVVGAPSVSTPGILAQTNHISNAAYSAGTIPRSANNVCAESWRY